jgi:MSHA biogenesis protein MshM
MKRQREEKQADQPSFTEMQDSHPPRNGPYPYRDYQAARESLRHAIQAGPIYALVTGPSGAGKSSLGKDIAQVLERPRFQIVYLSSSRASVLGLVNSLAQVLRVSPKRSSLETAQVVALALKGAPTRYVLWVDEADQVPPQTLGEIRILAESDLEGPQLLSVVMSGLPEIRAVLDRRDLFPLKRRISLRCHLAGLARTELDGFLDHRFGSAARQVPDQLRDELFERTEAIPALVEKVARFALERSSGSLVADSTLREAFDAAGL